MKLSEKKFRYVQFGRGHGHTQAMLDGAKSADNVAIVAHTQQWADELAKQCKNARGIGLDRTERLLGSHLPIVVDHYAIEVMLGERERYIAQLEAKLAAHLENEGDECPLCQLEAENEALRKAYEKIQDADGPDVTMPIDMTLAMGEMTDLINRSKP